MELIGEVLGELGSAVVEHKLQEYREKQKAQENVPSPAKSDPNRYVPQKGFTCFRCNQDGHYPNTCPTLVGEKQYAKFVHKQEVLENLRQHSSEPASEATQMQTQNTNPLRYVPSKTPSCFKCNQQGHYPNKCPGLTPC
jgi:hypothetical protein